MIRVFLLDDHEVVRRGLTDLLHAAGDIEVVGESGSAQEATRRIPALRPDVAILDARLPDGNGIDVCRDVRAVDSTIKGLILTSYEDDEALFAAIMAGASGYVLKQTRVRRGRPHQPRDRREDVPGGEDREELRLQPAGETRTGTAYPGGGAGHPPDRRAPPFLTAHAA
jgi:CheY-like chemotaxis protein